MKTGTDAVLLGAWFPLCQGARLLDIGCGSSIISLMVAQREPTLTIHAIEIDKAAAEQATMNVLRSPFAEKIQVIAADVNQYHWDDHAPFQHIVCNPPYFQQSLKSKHPQKNLARHDISLTYQDLLNLIDQLLHPNGSAGIIIPFSSKNDFVLRASSLGIYVRSQLIVKHSEKKPITRALLELTKTKTLYPTTQTLSIYHPDNTWTEDYKSLTGDFYLSEKIKQ